MNHLFIGGIISFEWVRALCWTLLHSIWQGMLAAVLAGIIILCTRHSKAVIRYNLLCVVFISFIVCSIYTFLHQHTFNVTGSSSAAVIRVDREQPLEAVVIQDTPKHFWSVPKERFLRPVIYYTNKYSSFIAGIWAIFFFMHFIKMIIGLRYVHRIRTKQTNPVSREWKERLFTISRMLGMRKLIGLKESALIKVPVVIGLFKPIILVPLGMFANLSVEQVETILVHELAHVRRRDFVVNLLQRFAESIFFFNPFIAWISSRLREEREACCDDIVMEYTTDKKIYVEALVSFRQTDFALHGHAMAIAGNNNLLNRVKRMITNENKKLNAMEKLTLILVVLAVTAFSFIPEKKNKTTRTELVSPKTSIQNPVDEIKIARDKRFGTLLSPSVTKNDTVPAPKQIRIKNISQNFDDDKKVIEVTALDGNGKKYNYRKSNDDILDFSVDGVRIDKQNISRYKSVIDKIENAVADMNIQSMGALQAKLDALKGDNGLFDLKGASADNKGLLNLKGLALQDQQLSLLKNNLDLQNNALMFDNDKLLFKMRADSLLTLRNNLGTLLPKQNDANLLLDLQGKLSILGKEDIGLNLIDSEINKIINDLAGAGVIGDSTELSFTLNYDELIVNGKKMSEELHEKLRKKYILHKTDHYKCKVSPNSRSTDIYKE